jgi:hypothetical protein
MTRISVGNRNADSQCFGSGSTLNQKLKDSNADPKRETKQR